MRRAIKIYVLVTQFIINMILGGILGAMLGKYIDPEGISEALYAGSGLILGLLISMMLLWQFFKNDKISEDKDKDEAS